MPYDVLEAISVDNFGGLNTLSNATDIPHFMSPDCQNVEFVPGRVQKRSGTSTAFTNGISTGNINYTKSYQQPNGNVQNLAIDSLGSFIYENVTFSPGSTSLVTGSLLQNLMPNSVTLFAREWLALGDGKQGQDIPRQYNGTNVYRVSQEGPGAPPSVSDFIPAAATIGTTAGITLNIKTSPNGIIWGGAVELNPDWPSTPSIPGWTTFTVVTTTPHGLTVGSSVTITGSTPAVVNGTWTVGHVTNSTTFFIFYTTRQSLVSNGGGGTIAGTSATLSMSRMGNVTTVFTSAAHGFQSNWRVQISGIPNVTVGGAASGTQLNGTVTITTATAHGMVPGATAIIAGMGDTTYNGTFTVVSAPSPTTFTYSQSTTNASTSGGTVNSPFNGIFIISTTPTATSFTYSDPGPNITSTSAGTATILGSVVGGTHQMVVQFLTIEGTLTPPSPPVTFVASGNKLLSASQIAIGPSNIIARYISITPISSGQFFYIPTTAQGALSTIINDNTTTAIILNFGDTDLLDGVNINAAFELLTLGEVVGFAEYNSRLVTWGQTNKIQNFVNLSFDGGFSQDTNVCPLGWTPDPTNYLGGGKAPTSLLGDAYAITGDGIHATQGLITQSAFQDYLGDAILSSNTAYTISARISKSNILPGAQLIIRLSSVSTSYSQSLTVNLQTQVNIGAFGKFTAALSVLPTTIPSDLIVSIFATNLSNGDSVYVDEIEFYPTLNSVETSVIRFSNVEDPESFDGLTGFQQPAEENGQGVRNCFILRDFFYIVKERSIFVTRDDGQNEPNAWEIDEVSSKIGTPSPRGVGLGDEWAVIAAQSGLWMFTGGQIWQQNNLLSNEIQPTWDSINWKLGHLVDVKVDTTKKRVYVNVPLGASATKNNTVLVVDYTEGWGDPAQNNGVGRKWCPWTLQANAINLCLQNDSSQVLYVGNNFNFGAIFKLDPAILNDYGSGLTPIDSYWQSGYFKNPTRLNYSYVVANAVGSGTLQMVLRTGDQGAFYPIRGWLLDPNGLKNMERQIQKQHYRMAIKFEVTGLTDDFMVQGFSMFMQEATWAPVRGVNF